MFEGSQVLVTGGSGFIGANLIIRLLELGANVRATLFEKDAVIVDDRVEYVRVDLREAADCQRAVEGMQYVFMCAANSSGAGVMAKTPLVHLTPNVIMNAQTLEAAYAASVEKFLFVSSSTVYPLTDFAVSEDDVTNEFFEKYHIVAWMKRFSEIVCDMYATKVDQPMKTVIVRPGNLYGPFDKFSWEKSKVIPALIRRAIERHDPFEVWGDGMDLKDFLYIEDCIDGLLLAMEKSRNFDLFNIASGRGVTIREVISEVLRATGFSDAHIVYDESKPTMIPKRMIDITRAKEHLGFEVKTPLQEGIQKTTEWYREFYASVTPENIS